MLNIQEINVLGQIFNDTFGYSSTTSSPTMSMKASLSGDVLTVAYTTIVTLVSDRNMRDQCKRHEEESVKLTDDFMKKTKKSFKDGAGRSLKVKQLGTDDSIQVITTSPYVLKKNAYYRRTTNFKVE
jgi:hypothetical protein